MTEHPPDDERVPEPEPEVGSDDLEVSPDDARDVAGGAIPRSQEERAKQYEGW